MTILGAVAGALIVIVFLTVRKLSDTRIKNEEDLAALFDMPILGRIPDLEQPDDGNAYSNAYAKVNGRRGR
jgi:capsular polysaccharide biosynthesis protein